MTLKERIFQTAVAYANAEVELAQAPTASAAWRWARKQAQLKWEAFEKIAMAEVQEPPQVSEAPQHTPTRQEV